MGADDRRRNVFEDPFAATRPVTIPSKKHFRTAAPSDYISTLLEQTRIPARRNRTSRRQFSTTDLPASPAASCQGSRPCTPQRRTSLFDADCHFIEPQSLPGSYSYLLTPPSSMPDLSRSYSTTSFDSYTSVTPSSCGKSPRRTTPTREAVDIASDDPLQREEEEEEEGNVFELLDSPTVQDYPRRRSSLATLLRPLKSSLSPSTMVSTLTSSLSSWTASLSAAQFDDSCGLLPKTTLTRHARDGTSLLTTSGSEQEQEVYRNLPRRVHASGPQRGQATIFEAEMERPLLAAEEGPCVELLPWQECSLAPSVPAVNVVPRAREARLNPDFLRILVLETNMRRLGKMAAGPGRARMILCPRDAHHRPSRLRCV